MMKRHRLISWIGLVPGFAMMAMLIGIASWPRLALAVDEPRSVGAEWLDKDYHYVVIDQNVRDVLTEFGRNLSLPMEISRQVEGRVRGDIPSGSAREFLDQIAAANGLAWFYDGGVLHVASRSEITQRTFDLQGIDSARLMRNLDRWRIGEPLTAQLIDDGSTLRVVGPASWIESMAQRIRRLRQSPSTGPGEVRVFRGSVVTRSQTASD